MYMSYFSNMESCNESQCRFGIHVLYVYSCTVHVMRYEKTCQKCYLLSPYGRAGIQLHIGMEPTVVGCS